MPHLTSLSNNTKARPLVMSRVCHACPSLTSLQVDTPLVVDCPVDAMPPLKRLALVGTSLQNNVRSGTRWLKNGRSSNSVLRLLWRCLQDWAWRKIFTRCTHTHTHTLYSHRRAGSGYYAPCATRCGAEPTKRSHHCRLEPGNLALREYFYLTRSVAPTNFSSETPHS